MTESKRKFSWWGIRAVSILLCLIGVVKADTFPDIQIPASDRVLSVTEVKNFWVNKVRGLRVPNKPNGLHPEAQRRWRAKLDRRVEFIKSVRAGVYDERAKLVQLRHNIEAWRKRGDEEKAEETKAELRKFEDYLAQLALAEQQRRVAMELEALRAEVSALRSACVYPCCH